MNEIINSYYEDNAKKLHKMVDKILFRLKFYDIDVEDFYSLANEVFVDVINRYNGMQDFNGFLYSSLYRKFCTEMTRRRRKKRQADKESISWETKIDIETGQTIGELIADTKIAIHYDIDKTFFEDDGEKYSEKMLKYISRLSNLQKEVVKLIIAGYKSEDIINILHITEKEYKDSIRTIRSYKNISILF